MTVSLPVLSYLAKPPADAIAVSLDQLMVGGLLLQAGSGGGKSRAIRQLLEETHGRVQHLVFDPEGEFGSLRECFGYIYAAPHGGDAVATPKTAKLLCRRLVETGASAVLDIYDLKLHEKRDFVRLFLEELMSLPRAQWKPILVVIDEADVFAPQKEESSSLEAIVDVNGRGRKRGYRLILTTRRLSKLDKDAADLQNRMIGRTGLDLDIKRAGDELGMDKAARQSLAQLSPGVFYVYGPAISATPILARTGAVRTTHPEAGRIGYVTPPAPASIRSLVAQLQDLPKEAEEEAKTLADIVRQRDELKRRVAQLEKGGAERVVTKPVADPAAIALAVSNARGQWHRDLERQERFTANRLRACRMSLDAVKVITLIEEGQKAPQSEAPEPRGNASSNLARAASTLPDEARSTNGQVTPTGAGAQRVLDALAELAAIGIPQPTRAQVGILANYDLTGGVGSKYVSRLRDEGLITLPAPGDLALSDAGSRQAVAPPAELTLEALHQRVLARLNDGEQRILKHLLEIEPTLREMHAPGLTRAHVGEAVRYDLTGGVGSKYVSKLVSLGFIDIPAKGHLRAGALLFPEALR